VDTSRATVLVVAEQLRRRVPGGIGTYVRGVLQGLDSLDDPVDVSLYASRPGRTPDPLAALGHPVLASPLPGPLLTRLWDRAWAHAPRGYALVHAMTLAAPPTSGAVLVVTVHDVAWRHLGADVGRRARRWHDAALARAVGAADHFVVPSQPVAADVVDAGATPEAVTVIPHGADHLPPPDHDGALRLLAERGVEGPFVLSVGTIEPRKNLSRLFRAFAAARPSLPGPWPLVVVGPRGWGRADVPSEAVVLAGPVPAATLAALYARARLLAYVPLEEGFGLPPVEAMGLGTPVLASLLPSVGDAALVVDPRSVDEIAAAIVRLATDEGLRAELVAAGLSRTADLTWKASAWAHVSLWRRLCAGL
jgi:glycosyltransferase involved in cell wall biosynthesis